MHTLINIPDTGELVSLSCLRAFSLDFFFVIAPISDFSLPFCCNFRFLAALFLTFRCSTTIATLFGSGVGVFGDEQCEQFDEITAFCADLPLKEEEELGCVVSDH